MPFCFSPRGPFLQTRNPRAPSPKNASRGTGLRARVGQQGSTVAFRDLHYFIHLRGGEVGGNKPASPAEENHEGQAGGGELKREAHVLRGVTAVASPGQMVAILGEFCCCFTASLYFLFFRVCYRSSGHCSHSPRHLAKLCMPSVLLKKNFAIFAALASLSRAESLSFSSYRRPQNLSMETNVPKKTRTLNKHFERVGLQAIKTWRRMRSQN